MSLARRSIAKWLNEQADKLRNRKREIRQMNTTLLPLKIESIQKDNFLPTYYYRQLNRPFINVFHYVDTTGQLQKVPPIVLKL